MECKYNIGDHVLIECIVDGIKLWADTEPKYYLKFYGTIEHGDHALGVFEDDIQDLFNNLVKEDEPTDGTENYDPDNERQKKRILITAIKAMHDAGLTFEEIAGLLDVSVTDATYCYDIELEPVYGIKTGQFYETVNSLRKTGCSDIDICKSVGCESVEELKQKYSESKLRWREETRKLIVLLESLGYSRQEIADKLGLNSESVFRSVESEG